MDSSWVKLVLAISLDGRLTFTPASKTNLGGKGDRRVLEEALSKADASLIGGQTLRIHGSTCLINNAQLLEKRKSEGLNLQPISIVVSKKVNFSKTLPFFSQPISRWLITNKKKSEQVSSIKVFDNQIIMHRNWTQTLKQLYNEGLSNIVVLGGARLINSLLKEDKIDELQLTIAPKLLGGENSWIPYQTSNLPKHMYSNDSWLLKGIEKLGDNEIMVQYIRNRIN